MSIQKEQAKGKGLDLRIIYVNISEEVNVKKESILKDESLEMFSPIIKSDVSRI